VRAAPPRGGRLRFEPACRSHITTATYNRPPRAGEVRLPVSNRRPLSGRYRSSGTRPRCNSPSAAGRSGTVIRQSARPFVAGRRRVRVAPGASAPSLSNHVLRSHDRSSRKEGGTRCPTWRSTQWRVLGRVRESTSTRCSTSRPSTAALMCAPSSRTRRTGSSAGVSSRRRGSSCGSRTA